MAGGIERGRGKGRERMARTAVAAALLLYQERKPLTAVFLARMARRYHAKGKDVRAAITGTAAIVLFTSDAVSRTHDEVAAFIKGTKFGAETMGEALTGEPGLTLRDALSRRHPDAEEKPGEA